MSWTLSCPVQGSRYNFFVFLGTFRLTVYASARSGLLLCLIKKSARRMQVHGVKPTFLHLITVMHVISCM